MRHTIARYEPGELVEALEAHIALCPRCQVRSGRPDPKRLFRGRCMTGERMHEALVLRAHEERYRSDIEMRPPLWTQHIDLDEVDTEQRLQEFLAERDLALATQPSPSMLQRLRERLLRTPVTTLEGVDVSVWQGRFPWWEADQAGVSLGIAKATEGYGYTDPQWGNSVVWLLSQTSIVGGSYHFSRQDLGNSAINEANFYLGQHPGQCFVRGQPWVFAHDAESAGGSAAWCYAFLNTVSARIGYSCWFYSYSSWITSRGIQAFSNPLWEAWPNPGDPPPLGWPTITMHQYGTRPFSVGAVDANRFWGDRSTLLTLAGTQQAALPQQASGGESSMVVLNYNGTTYRIWVRDLGRSDQYGDVCWGVFSGAEGTEEGYSGNDTSLGGLIEAGSLAAYARPYGGTVRVVIYGQGLDGRIFRAIMDGTTFATIESWTPLSLRVGGSAAAVKSIGVGAAGPPGPAGPATYVPHKHNVTEDGGAPI